LANVSALIPYGERSIFRLERTALARANPFTVAIPNRLTACATLLISRLKPYSGELAALRRLAVSIGSFSTTWISSWMLDWGLLQIIWIFWTDSGSGGRDLIRVCNDSFIRMFLKEIGFVSCRSKPAT